MLKQNQHIIHEEVFEINLEGMDRKAAYDFQNELSEFNRSHIMHVISDVFDEFSTDGMHHRFDYLEIDFGDISLKNFKKNFVKILKTQLRKTIKEAIAKDGNKASQANYQKITTEQSKQEIIQFYLEEGRLPWQATENSEDLEEIFHDFLNQNPRKVHQLLDSIPNKKQLYGRITSRFSNKIIEQLLGVIEPTNAKKITRFIKRWKRLQAKHTQLKISHVHFEKTLWKEALFILEKNTNLKQKNIVILLLDKVSEKLKINAKNVKYLKTLLLENSDEGVSNEFKEEHNDLDLFRHYLKHGSLPYWANIDGKEALENLLVQLLNKKSKSIYHVFQLEMENDATVFLRVLYQFNQKIILQILDAILPENDARTKQLYQQIEQYKSKPDASIHLAQSIQQSFFKILNLDFFLDKKTKYPNNKNDGFPKEIKGKIDDLLEFIKSEMPLWNAGNDVDNFDVLLENYLSNPTKDFIQKLKSTIVEPNFRTYLLEQIPQHLQVRLMEILLGKDTHDFIIRLQSVMGYMNEYLPKDAPYPKDIFTWQTLYKGLSSGKSASYMESLLTGEWIKQVPVSKKHLAILFKRLSKNMGGQTLQLSGHPKTMSIQDIATRILLQLPEIKETFPEIPQVKTTAEISKETITPKSVKRHTPPENPSPLDYMLHFLEIGEMPIWKSLHDGESFGLLLKNSLDHPSKDFIQKLRTAIVEPSIRNRLLEQIPQHSQTRLMEVLLGKDTHDFIIRLQSVMVYVNEHLPKDAPSPKDIFTWQALYKSLSSGKSVSYMESLLTGEWIKQVPVSRKHLAILFKRLSKNVGGRILQLAGHPKTMSIQDITTRILLRLPEIKETFPEIPQAKTTTEIPKEVIDFKPIKRQNAPPENPSPLDYILHFLKEGGMPAWGGIHDGESFELLLENCLNHQAEALGRRLKFIIGEQSIQNRLLRQVPHHLHPRLMETLLGTKTYSFILRFQSVIVYVNEYLPADAPSAKDVFAWEALYKGLSLGKSTTYMESMLTGEWIKQVPISKKDLAVLFKKLSQKTDRGIIQLAEHQAAMSVQDIVTRILLRLPEIKEDLKPSVIEKKSQKKQVELSEKPNSIDYILHFLKEGKLPILETEDDGKAFEILFKKSLENQAETLVQKLRLAATEQIVRERLLQVIPPKLQTQFMEIFLGKETHLFILRLQSVIVFLNQYLPSKTPSSKDVFTWAALYKALSANKSASYMESLLTGEWIKKIPISKKDLALLLQELSGNTKGKNLQLVAHPNAMSIQDIATRILLRLPDVKEGERLETKPDGTFLLPEKEKKETRKQEGNIVNPIAPNVKKNTLSKGESKSDSADSPPKNPVPLDYLVHFLKHGKRPWWNTAYDDVSVVELLEKCLNEDVADLIIAIKAIIREPTIKKRLFQQLPNSLQSRLMMALLGKETHASLQNFQSVIAFLENYLPKQKIKAKDLFQWESFHAIALSGKDKTVIENRMIEEWLSKIAVKPISLAMLFWHLTERGGNRDILLFKHQQAQQIQSIAMEIRKKLPYQRVENQLQAHFKDIFLYPKGKKTNLQAVRKWLDSGFVEKPLEEKELVRLFTECLATQPHLAKLLVQQYLKTRKSRQRFIALFPLDVIVRLLSLSTTVSMMELGAMMKGTIPIATKLLGIPQKKYESLFIEAVLDYLIFQPGSSKAATVAWFVIQHISSQTDCKLEQELLKELPGNHPLILAKRKEGKSSNPISSTHTKSENMPAIHKRSKNPAINPFARNSRKSKSKKNKKGAPERRIRTKKGKYVEQEENSIFIKNAGLVILQPYLPPLFRRLGINPNNDEEKGRAAHLLQYLAVLSSSSPEEDLPLNKILAGMPLKEPIVASVELTDLEQKTCNGLLQGACQNWEQMKSSSIMDFRVSFLIRDGLLTETDSHWKLVVDQRPYDLLLKTLPWGISMVKYPWMPKSIIVTWA